MELSKFEVQKWYESSDLRAFILWNMAKYYTHSVQLFTLLIFIIILYKRCLQMMFACGLSKQVVEVLDIYIELCN